MCRKVELIRKHQQEKLLDIVKTIGEAQAAGLYADSQEGAIYAGDYIESIKGEGTKTVALLEEYCELLYRASLGKTVGKTLNRLLGEIKRSIRNELSPDRIEVVFISYQASMSDSFESIYLAAREDPVCDAYFIPVPYFDRNPDTTIGKMHYEGADYYGSHLEITDFKEYNIAERHPDVIFTNNPYDDGNRVTCVHPDYFIRKMKNETDMLCYISYALPYALDGTTNLGAVKTTVAKPFDLLIAAAESDRLTYLAAAPEMNVVALGSPKLDRIIRLLLEKMEIPAEWREKIPDFANKKIIMLNSSLGHLLQYNDKYIDRLDEYITSAERCGDVVLIFRPHPLMAATLRSMRPSLYDKYATLESRVEQGNFGIFDTSADFMPAFLLSDAYAGELESSIARMYTLTGKPIFATVVEREAKRDELRGGALIFDYPETDEFTFGVFLNKLVTGEIAAVDEKQIEYQNSIFANCDGTCGEKIYEYVKSKFI